MARPVRTIKPRPWMRDAATRQVMRALTAADAEPRFVGGAVRDALLGRLPREIDIAKPLEPDAVMRLLSAAGIRAVPTGIAHGTVTAATPKRNFEITTLRRDVETDGRHAKVAFGVDWAADAQRRDFTMNALSLDRQGRLYDDVGGLADLKAGRVRFVGDPAARIREDVLRLLRYYRFFAYYGKGSGDRAARAACRAAAHLLPTLSAERITAEFLKLLSAPDPLPALRMMQTDGVLNTMLPENVGLVRLRRLVVLEPAADPIRRLAALIPRDAGTVADRFKLSGAQRERLEAVLTKPAAALRADRVAQRRALYCWGSSIYADRVLLAAAARPRPHGVRKLLRLAQSWKSPRFPLRGRDLLAAGVAPGPEVGVLLAALEAWWIKGDFRATAAQCRAELRRRLTQAA
ncbi:MAG: CCA tRNA nucleotidyltransferase [Alphaproteobacteria bacterium]|nr:CCA tRNA nucleotidyltransferase [Alphaproteobacteria bacterium]